MGRPIIQYPQDLVAVQEIIWEFKPKLIIETGIANDMWRALFEAPFN
jgi:cephalosporin hydroxylase